MDPYRELGLSPEAANEPELVRAAFKALAKKYHPDAYQEPAAKASAEEKMKLLNEAQRLILSGEYRPNPPACPPAVPETVVPPPHRQASPPAGKVTATSPRNLAVGPILFLLACLLALVLLPTMLGHDHLAEAQSLEEQGRLGNALEAADRAIKNDPRNAEAFLLRARLYKKLGHLQRARVDLDNARSLLSRHAYEQAELALFPTPSASPQAAPSPSVSPPPPP